MVNLSVSTDGKAALLACGAAPALVVLAGEGVVKGSASAAQQVARAIANLSTSSVCLEACAASLGDPDVAAGRGSFSRVTPTQYISWVLDSSSRADPANDAAFASAAAFVASDAPRALVALCAEDCVRRSADAAGAVVRALAYLALFPAGRVACVAAGTAAALVALASAPASLEAGGDSKAALCVALAISCVASGAEGRAALVEAGAGAALAALARTDLGAEAAEQVARAAASLGGGAVDAPGAALVADAGDQRASARD